MKYHLSDEISPLKRSVMRDLLKFAVSPDIISLAGGLPPSEILPTDELRQAYDRVLTRDGASALQYSPQYAPLKEWIAAYMQSCGVSCTEDQIFITNGNQQGLALLSRLFFSTGDPVVIENLVFTGIQQATAGRGASIRPIKTNLNTGVDIEDFEAALSQKPTPKLAVLIPDFHNPLGVSISAEKRAQIALLAAKYKVPIIEDDPYSSLRFEGTPLPPIKGYDEDEFIFYLGSFSKMLAPTLRLGWMIAPVDLIPKITVLRESIDLETSSLTQRVVAEFLTNGLLPLHLSKLTTVLENRKNALESALMKHLGDLASWTTPQGGLFSWVTLPEGIDTWKMFQKAVDQKVAYIPGSAFSVDGRYTNTLRLNFSNATPAAIEDGIARLSGVIKTALRQPHNYLEHVPA